MKVCAGGDIRGFDGATGFKDGGSEVWWRWAPAGEAFCRRGLGVARVIDMLSGEQLPRIC